MLSQVRAGGRDRAAARQPREGRQYQRGALRLCSRSGFLNVCHVDVPRLMQCCTCRQEQAGAIMLPHISREKDGKISEELCASAAAMANALGAAAIFVYTRRGFMANWLSRQRPDCPIFAFTGALALTC